MRKLIIQILSKWACCHEWAKLEQVTNYTDSSLRRNLPESFDFIYTCKKCGKIKRTRL